MAPIPSFTLNTGARIPAIGLGAAAGRSPDAIAGAKMWILSALKAGYRHIDTAYIYGTEKTVGEALRESGIPREEIFITTKLAWDHQHRVAASFEESLQNLGLDYVDLYLVHFPQRLVFEADGSFARNPDGSHKVLYEPTINEVWEEMEKIFASGRAKAIGVSNFSIKTLGQLLTTAKVIPATLQVELHPYLAQPELVKYAQEKGIIVQAYTPTGYATVRNDTTIVALAEKHKVSTAQIVLGWHIARGCVAVPKSENPGRQKENIDLPVLSKEDVEVINGLDRNERLCNKADEFGKVYGWTYEELGW